MKAEHRKELETNVLADKMGQAMQRVKSGKRSTFVLTLIAAAAVVIIGWIAYRYFTEGKQELAQEWLFLDDGSEKNLFELSKSDSTAGKAARLQLAWLLYWELGVKKLGSDQMRALMALDEAAKIYRKVGDECAEEDPLLFLPQAKLGVAVCDESRAVRDRSMLKKAIAAYEELQADKFKGTAESQFAKSRLDDLKDAKKATEIAGVYEELQKLLKVPAMQAPAGFGDLPERHPEIKKK